MSPLLKPKWMKIIEAEETHSVCSWCGVSVAGETAQVIHEDWHRAVGVIPVNALSEDDSL